MYKIYLKNDRITIKLLSQYAPLFNTYHLQPNDRRLGEHNLSIKFQAFDNMYMTLKFNMNDGMFLRNQVPPIDVNNWDKRIKTGVEFGIEI